MKRKYIFIIFAVIIAIILIGYIYKKSGNVMIDETKYYSEQMLGFSTEEGIYHTDSRNFLCFYDFKAQKDVFVCSKPNCKHNDENIDNETAETRCNAYLGNTMSTGFTMNEQLYLIQIDPIEQLAVIIRSEPDRSKQKKIAEFKINYLSSFVVKNESLYLASSAYIMEEDENGMEVPSGEAETWLYCIDLNTGKAKELTSKLKENNSSLTIVGVNGDSLYCKNTFFNKPFDGTNFEEAEEQIKWYALNTKTGEYKEVFSGFSGAGKACIVKDKLVGYEGIEWLNGEYKQYNVQVLDITTGAVDVLKSLNKEPQFVGGKVIFQKKEGEETKYYSYDINEGKEKEMPDNIMREFTIFQEVENYFWGYKMDTKTEKSVPCLILKQDLYNGEKNYIFLN